MNRRPSSGCFSGCFSSCFLYLLALLPVSALATTLLYVVYRLGVWTNVWTAGLDYVIYLGVGGIIAVLLSLISMFGMNFRRRTLWYTLTQMSDHRGMKRLDVALLGSCLLILAALFFFWKTLPGWASLPAWVLIFTIILRKPLRNLIAIFPYEDIGDLHAMQRLAQEHQTDVNVIKNYNRGNLEQRAPITITPPTISITSNRFFIDKWEFNIDLVNATRDPNSPTQMILLRGTLTNHGRFSDSFLPEGQSFWVYTSQERYSYQLYASGTDDEISGVPMNGLVEPEGQTLLSLRFNIPANSQNLQLVARRLDFNPGQEVLIPFYSRGN